MLRRFDAPLTTHEPPMTVGEWIGVIAAAAAAYLVLVGVMAC